VCERLLAIQAQDPMGARLAIRSRSRGLTVDDFNRALNSREIVVTWLNRGTLHLVRAEDYHWLQAVMVARRLTSNDTRLGQLGVAADAADRDVRTIVDALASHGPLTRAELAARVRHPHAFLHVINRAARLGLVVRGPMRGKQHCYVLVRDWLGETPAVDRDTALRELGRRYLAAHAPADEQDLAKWAGISLGDSRVALREAAAPRRRAAAPPPARLLGTFEEMLLGWKSRELFVGDHEGDLVAGGMFLPVLMAGGRAVGSWGMPAGRLVLRPFDSTALSPEDAAALAEDFADVRRFLGQTDVR
jgi:winged helix DNA-binding protein